MTKKVFVEIDLPRNICIRFPSGIVKNLRSLRIKTEKLVNIQKNYLTMIS